MRPRPLTAVIAAGTAVAVGGALVDARPALAIGGLVTLLVLAGHPALCAAPKPSRLLLWTGLACLAAAVVVTVSRWTHGDPWTADDLRNLWQKPLLLATLELMACACFGVALARAPHERLRGQGLALPAVVGLLALAAGASNEAQTAWRNRPIDDMATGMLIAVSPGPVLDVQGALTIGTLLIGAATTVLAGAHLARR
jgi:hypothetical protein